MSRKAKVTQQTWRALSALLCISMTVASVPSAILARPLPSDPEIVRIDPSSENSEEAGSGRQVAETVPGTTSPDPDTSKPVNVTIATPADGAVVNSPTVVVTGDIQGTDDVKSVVVNGITARVSNGAFSATVPVEPGNQAVHVVTTDSQGRVSIASRGVHAKVVRRPTAGPPVERTGCPSRR